MLERDPNEVLMLNKSCEVTTPLVGFLDVLESLTKKKHHQLLMLTLSLSVKEFWLPVIEQSLLTKEHNEVLEYPQVINVMNEDAGDGKKGKDKGGAKKKKNESEYKKGLRPVLWLTPDFPLKTEEVLPLLDILTNKVKGVRRLRELLTTKLPTGTFPVKGWAKKPNPKIQTDIIG
ncbi:hypothetical protein YC2023_073727 [Brassica napus]